MGVISIIAYLGAVSVFKKSKNNIQLIKSTSKKVLAIIVLLILFVGGALGGFNYYTARNVMSVDFSFKLTYIFDAIRGGVAEEMIFRFFFFSVCAYFTKDKAFSKVENFLCYLIMIVPHTLLHFNQMNFNVVNILVLSLVFGLPFALLQRKHGLLYSFNLI